MRRGLPSLCSFFCIVTGGVVLWLGGMLAEPLIRFFRYSSSQEVIPYLWRVVEVKGHRFAVEALYTLSHEGKSYRSIFRFRSTYANSYIARDIMEQWRRQPCRAWFSPKCPESSSLQNDFPYRRMIYFCVSVAVLLYFCCLFRYLSSFL